MKRRVIKSIYIGLFGLFILSMVLLISSLLLRILFISPIDSSATRLIKNISDLYVGSSIILLIATFIGFVNSLSLPPTSRNEVEKIILPIVFISFSFLIIPSVINYLLVNRIYTMSFTFLARLYFFFAYFSSSLLVISGMFSLGINSSKMGRYILFIGVLSFFIASMMDVDIASYPQQSMLWTNREMFISTLSVIAGVGCINYWAIYIRESTQHNMLKAMRIMLILLGVIGFISFPESIISLISVFLYTIGVLFGLSRKRFNQL